MPSQSFDLIIIGAGPGGYVCAFRAAQLGLKVALVDKRAALGGTCLNVGCIPSKALLHATEHFAWAKHHAADSGIKLGSVEVDLPTMMKKKDAVVTKLTGGVAMLAKGRKVTVVTGTASFVSPTEIAVTGPAVAGVADPGPGSTSPATTTKLTAKHFVIATGSAPVELPFMKFDGETVVSSDHAIAFASVPKKLVVVGGGVIGVELGSVWARLGAEVTVVEFLPKIIATFDDDIVRQFTRLMQKQGLKIEVGAKVTGYANGILTAERDGAKIEIPADKVLVAVAEWIAGKHGHINWDLVPGIVYTNPEVASVGLGEDEAKKRGLAINVGKFNFAANGRAIAADATDGFVKIIADAKTDKILGAQILGHNAGELISEVVTHMEYGGSAEDLGRTIHGHPTMSEAVKEAALAVSKSAIHAL